jgi:HAE1 family hydrophobic/amphiphilic exporter-1
MRLAEVSVKRPVFAIMMTAALIVLGAFSYKDLGLDLMPKTDSPNVNVQVQLPGASAEEVETQITKRIEEAVNTISGIDELRANSNQGQGQANITFALERDIESATQDVRDKVATPNNRRSRSRIPTRRRFSSSTSSARGRRRRSPRSPTSRSSRCSKP